MNCEKSLSMVWCDLYLKLHYVAGQYLSRDCARREHLADCVACLVACVQNCRVCNTNGPAKCDPGQCNRHYAYNSSTESCVGESFRFSNPFVTYKLVVMPTTLTQRVVLVSNFVFPTRL